MRDNKVREAEEQKVFKEEDCDMIMESIDTEDDEDITELLEELEELEDGDDMTVEMIETQQETTIVWSEIRATKSKQTKKPFGEEGICTIVNAKSKRIVLASKLLEQIGNPTEVEVGILDNGIAIAKSLPIETNVFSVKNQGAKKIIYAGALVTELTQEFNLDYSTRTSITFNDVMYEKVGGNEVAIIKIA